MDESVVAGLATRLLDFKLQKHFALDRTNWKLGKTDINILVLVLVLVLTVVTPKLKIPVMWSFMDHRGNSSTSQRIDLMKQYIDVFGVPSIQTLLGDQEFVGDEWLTYLAENNLSFSIHLRKDLYIEAEDGRRFQFSLLLHKKRNGRWKGWLCGMARAPENLLRLEGKNIKDELVVVATNIPAPKTRSVFIGKDGGLNVSSPIPKPVAST